MRCSLFGKLGAKRDFIALATPRRFLETWEPWVQACMSASRHQLGGAWQNAFLTAPLWRFWLGADICGATALGAIMPSVDGVGRYYPLTLLAIADPSQSIPPPDLDAQDQWFFVAEQFLLSTLDQTRSFEDISAALDVMPAPPAMATVSTPDDIFALGDTLVGMITAGKTFRDSLSVLRQCNHETSAAASFWWTEGGGNFPPMALCSRGMPDPFRYSTMLTGKQSNDEIESAS
jgi:type VI secretion system protein ImpM